MTITYIDEILYYGCKFITSLWSLFTVHLPVCQQHSDHLQLSKTLASSRSSMVPRHQVQTLALYLSTTHIHEVIASLLLNKSVHFILQYETKLDSFSRSCKHHQFKTVNMKIWFNAYINQWHADKMYILRQLKSNSSDSDFVFQICQIRIRICHTITASSVQLCLKQQISICTMTYIICLGHYNKHQTEWGVPARFGVYSIRT